MNHRPKRSLGQNFLQDLSIVDKILSAATIKPGEKVIEIGPGQGALTERLMSEGAHVTAIEFDSDLAEHLRQRFASEARFRMIEADVLSVDLGDLVPVGKAEVVANLPYNISTPVLQQLIDARESFSILILMFQREVADRITAKPKNSERGYLTVLTEMAFEAERLFDVPPTAFYPRPKVWSSVVRLIPKATSPLETMVKEVASRGFAQKRKTLANNLSQHYSKAGEAMHAAELPEKCRAEELTLAEWMRLATYL